MRSGRIYLDNPGGTQVHASVIEAVSDYYLHSNANLGGPFATSIASDRILAEARSQVAAFLGAGAEEIAFGANMTTLTMHASRTLFRELGPGDGYSVPGGVTHGAVGVTDTIAIDSFHPVREDYR